jgi:hypothetical protein
MKDERRCFTSSFISPRSSFSLEAMKGVEPLSSGLQDRRSFYPIELHRRSETMNAERGMMKQENTLLFIVHRSEFIIRFGGAKRSRTSISWLQGRHLTVGS